MPRRTAALIGVSVFSVCVSKKTGEGGGGGRVRLHGVCEEQGEWRERESHLD